MYYYILYIYPEIDYNLRIVLFLNSDCKNSIVKAITGHLFVEFMNK